MKGKDKKITFLGAGETLGSGQKILSKKQRMYVFRRYLG